MPDPILIAQATGLGFAASALLMGILSGWGYRRKASPAWIDAGWILGIGAGFYLGCWWLGLGPHWPPVVDMDRLLAIVVPAALGVELLATLPSIPRPLIWTLRMAVAGGVGRVLLHGSIYLSDPGEPGTLAWSPLWKAMILGLMAAAQGMAWVSLVLLAQRSRSATTLIGLAIAVGGSAIAIMLSGYASGGLAGLAMTSALLGASGVTLFTTGPARLTAPIGVAVVGLSGLLVIGRFFGELRTDHAVLLFLAPLLAWLPELPRLRQMPKWARGLSRLVLVGVVVCGVLADVGRRFAEGWGPSASGTGAAASPYDAE
ncbi:MAG: hypothetical protein ACLQGP_32890 [Isosphaeraceae bacterium]